MSPGKWNSRVGRQTLIATQGVPRSPSCVCASLPIPDRVRAALVLTCTVGCSGFPSSEGISVLDTCLPTKCLTSYYFDDTRNNVMKKRVAQFSALGQEDRLQIFRMLVRAGPEGNCVDEIKRRFKIPGSTLSHHLDALTRCGLLNARPTGRFIYYAINWRETANLIHFLTEDCCADMYTKLAEGSTQVVPSSSKNNQTPCCVARGTARRTRPAAGLTRTEGTSAIYAEKLTS
jgi:ArsR family transcriptional regulator, arsenate/arsenite/antimonite-responsive transcriptional repressor